MALTTALVQRWPMTNLLDILKETELRVRFTEAFRTVGTREMLKPEVLQRRLLLCLYGLGTNAGLKRMCSGGGEDGYADSAVHSAALHHEGTVAGSDRAGCATPFSASAIRSYGAKERRLAHRTRRSSARGIRT